MNAPAPVVSGVGNIILPVSDMERSLAFYRDTVGLSVRFATQGFAYLHAGAVMLVLRQVDRVDPVPDGSRVEVVLDVVDVDVAYVVLKTRGVVFRVQPRQVTGDRWATDFRDPDGHLLSIFGPSAAGAKP